MASTKLVILTIANYNCRKAHPRCISRISVVYYLVIFVTIMAEKHISKPKHQGNGKKAGKMFEFKFELNLKNIVLGLFVAFLLFSLIGSLSGQSSVFPDKPLSTVIADVKLGKVAKIEVEDEKLLVEYKGGEKVITHKEPQESLIKLLESANVDPKGVEIKIKDLSVGQLWLGIITNVLPLILTVLFFLFIFRQARGAQDNLFSFGQSKALGARTPKGVILVGPSGTGKTLLAKAMAGEARTSFYSIAGSEFMEMLVGVGAARVRDLFASAKKSAPAIIFIDEIDAIGRMRSVGIMGGHDEREQTLNQILVEMDGFEPNTTVLIVAATNRGDLLDPALLRPGRFDRRVVLDLPDMAGRKAILSIHAKGKPFSVSVDWDKIAKRTVGFSGADLENMLNEAAILAARENKKEIDMKDLEEAATKVKLGPEKKRLQSDMDRKMTAYHEGGHAVVSYFSPNLDIVHRISIVSRGIALGYTLSPPEKDRLHETKSRLIEEIAMTMGGRAAEQIIFNEMTSGAANDIDQATRIARYMVMEFGMSDLGPINFGPQMDMTEWGKSIMEQSPVSQEMQGAIDREVKKFLDEGYRKAVEILKKHRKQLDIIAEELIKKETVESEEFEALMGGPKRRGVLQ